MRNNSGSVLIDALTATFGIPSGPGALLLFIFLIAAFGNSPPEIGMNSSIVGGSIKGIKGKRHFVPETAGIQFFL